MVGSFVRLARLVDCSHAAVEIGQRAVTNIRRLNFFTQPYVGDSLPPFKCNERLDPISTRISMLCKAIPTQNPSV